MAPPLEIQMSHNRTDIVPQAIPGTHGTPSKVDFKVVELTPHKKHPSYMANGKTLFKGNKAECEEFVEKE